VPARVAKVHQGVEVGVCHRVHMAAPAAVTTVGSAKFFVFFVPERDAATAAIACGDVNKSFVNKFHGEWGQMGRSLVYKNSVLSSLRVLSKQGSREGLCISWAGAAASINKKAPLAGLFWLKVSRLRPV